MNYEYSSDCNDDVLARMITEQEKNELDVHVIWTGDKEIDFEANEEEAINLLAVIITKMNLMQDQQFYSYPLASFMRNLAGELYMSIVDVRDFFPTIVAFSGNGNTARVGKSLMTNMWQWALLGHKPVERLLKVTEAGIFDLLDQGIPIYRK